jgi:hypothetical protein
LTAVLTSAVSAVVEKVRATIMREKQSRIAQQYTLPSQPGCSVMSVQHSSFGPSGGEPAINQVNGGVDADQTVVGQHQIDQLQRQYADC